MFARTGAALLLGALLTGAQAQVRAQEATDPAALAELYGVLPATSQPDLSPDGRTLARRVVHDGRYALRIDPLDGQGKPKLWRPADGATLGRFFWTGDGDLLVISEKLSAYQTSSLDPSTGRRRRYVAFFDAQRPQVLTREGREVARMTFRRLGEMDAFNLLAEPELSAGALPVFVSTRNGGSSGGKFSPATVDLGTGHSRFTAPPVKGAGFFTYTGSADGAVVIARRRSFDDQKRQVFRRVGDAWEAIPEGPLTDAVILDVTSKDTLILGLRGAGVFAYDVNAGQLSAPLYEGGDWHGVLRSGDRTRVVGVWHAGGVTFTDEEAAAAHAQAEAVLGEPARPIDASHDGRLRLVTTGGAGPTRYHLIDTAAGEVVRTLSAFPTLAARPRPDVTALRYAARDGLEIEGYLSTAAGAEPGTLPLVVFPHGGPASRDDAGFDAWREYLTSLGFAVFQPNFRGSTGYGAAFAAAGKREWGAAMQTDIVDGVRHLVSEGLTDGERLAIMGASYGGYAALMGTLDETPYRCAVSINGVTDLIGMLEVEGVQGGFSYWNDHIGKGVLSDDELTARSPLRRAGEIDVPVLLIHGGLDIVVRKGQSAALEEAMDKAGRDVRAVYLGDSRHDLAIQPDRRRALAEAGAFLTECLSD